MKVLLVEDCADDARQFVLDLWAAGFRCEVRADLPALSELVGFDLLVCDLNLPTSPAAETIEWLRRVSLPVVVVSGLVLPEWADLLDAAGVWAILPKDSRSAAAVCRLVIKRARRSLGLMAEIEALKAS